MATLGSIACVVSMARRTWRGCRVPTVALPPRLRRGSTRRSASQARRSRRRTRAPEAPRRIARAARSGRRGGSRGQRRACVRAARASRQHAWPSIPNSQIARRGARRRWTRNWLQDATQAKALHGSQGRLDACRMLAAAGHQARPPPGRAGRPRHGRLAKGLIVALGRVAERPKRRDGDRRVTSPAGGDQGGRGTTDPRAWRDLSPGGKIIAFQTLRGRDQPGLDVSQGRLGVPSRDDYSSFLYIALMKMTLVLPRPAFPASKIR